MKNKILIYGLAAAVFANAAPPRVAITEPDEIKDLDRCVQKRFQDPAAISQRRFGMGRMGPRRTTSPQPPPNRPSPMATGYREAKHHRDIRDFKSENPAEQAVIDAFQAKGYEVIVYLAGRKILEQPPAKTQIRNRYGVQGPALITGKMPADPPSTRWLLAESRTALESFEIGDGYTLKRGTWTVAMRPLRAANSGCVSCHTSGVARDKDGSKINLAVGDAVGVAIYAYRQVDSAKGTESSK
jgi:hypothetical protein